MPGVYQCTGSPRNSSAGVSAPARELGREADPGVRGVPSTLKLEGGRRGRGVERSMSGVAARPADARKESALSGR